MNSDIKNKTLDEISSYVNERMNVNELHNSTYISTENMLPNKAGITDATTLPNMNLTSAFKVGDVLVSNIRPYFKKIWQATFDGGCSNDVLVFRAKDGTDSKYLYYVLSNDKFFDYSMSTSKGTKMPRGDKKSLMEYSVPDINTETQRKIAKVLSAIDDKIELNNSINKNLEQQAQAIFKSWFVDFEPFDGTMPDGWITGHLSDLADIKSGKRPNKKSTDKTIEMNIPIVGAASIMGYTNEYLYNEKILVTGRVGTHGVIQKFCTPCWTSDNTLVILTKYYEFIYQVLKTVDFQNMNRGSTQPLITQTDLKNIEIIIPGNDILENFEEKIDSLMKLQNNLLAENERLTQLRDTLLPKLMSGEIDVSNVEIEDILDNNSTDNLSFSED